MNDRSAPETNDLPAEEITWSFRRTRELFREGRPEAEVLAIVKEEAKGKPWL